MITVRATREGLIGGKTATGYIVDVHVPFVALPSTAALRQWVKVYNSKTGKSCRALVMDVGPWEERDHSYVFQPATTQRNGIPPWDKVKDLDGIRPRAEMGSDSRGRETNGAGIDLGEAVWAALGMKDNGLVSWEFE